MKRDQLSIEKTSVAAVTINSLQIACALGLTVYVLRRMPSGDWAKAAVVLLFLIVAAGAVMDIREALHTQRIHRAMEDLTQTIENVEELNKALRIQRHDFRNHMGVVMGLLQLEEPEEALKYLRQVNEDLNVLSKSLKTGCPAVNALLMAKAEECRQRGIRLQTDTVGVIEALPIPEWELCRVLSNLIDNAADALDRTRKGQIQVTLEKREDAFCFSVGNNGPRIPDSLTESIFEAGFSKKGTGRGMGLYIARNTLLPYQGSLQVSSEEHWTVFRGQIPIRS